MRDIRIEKSIDLVNNVTFVGYGSVRGRLYNLGEYPGMVLSHRDDEKVLGEVYSLRREIQNATLKSLDEYEGVTTFDRGPGGYARQVVVVNMTSGNEVKAWAYVFKGRTSRLEWIKSGDYLSWHRKQNES